MSRRANPTIVGSFVLGAVFLVVVGLGVFGSGRFFTRHPRAVAFFDGSIQGLTVGSSVNFRGVPVGQVTDIKLQLNVDTVRAVIPVYLEFDPSHFIVSGDMALAERAKQKPLKAAIAHGLHARLATQSLVTGQLNVELDIDPNEPRRLIGADPSTVEIPTSPSDIEKLKKALTELPLDKIASQALDLLQNANRLISSKDTSRLIASLADAAGGLNALISDAHENLDPLVADFHATTGAGRDTLAAAQAAIADLRTALTAANQLLNGDVRAALRTAVATLQNAERLLANADSLLAVNSPQRYDIDQALRNLTAASRSLRAFAEDLERRPNAIVVGK